MVSRSCCLALWNAAFDYCMQYDPDTFQDVLGWFRQLPSPSEISDEDFYLEYCYVVLHPGVSTVVAKSIFERIRPVLDRPLPEIVRNENRIRTRLLRVYRNDVK